MSINDSELIDKGELSPYDDLIKKTERFGRIGWFVAGVFCLLSIVLTLIIALTPKQFIAVDESGIPIGQVVFSEPAVRDREVIIADIQSWVTRCTTVDKVNVFKDLAVCLNHMTKELSEQKLKQYEDTNYAQQIRENGCSRTETEFDPTKTELIKDKTGYFVQATLEGRKLCFMSGEKRPTEQAFAFKVEAKLVLRKENQGLGLEVYNYENI